MKTLDTLSAEIVDHVKTCIPAKFADYVYCNITKKRPGLGNLHLITVGVRGPINEHDNIVARAMIGDDCELTSELMVDAITPICEVMAKGLKGRK